MIRLIAAIDSKRGLSKDNQIPWEIAADINRFRQLTLTHGARVLVGRTTYELLGRYFDDHKAYVVLHRELVLKDRQTLVKDIDKFLDKAKEDIWVIGGAEVYSASIKYADELYLTLVDGDFKCDKFFPEYKDFKIKNSEGPLTDNGFTYYYQLLTRF